MALKEKPPFLILASSVKGGVTLHAGPSHETLSSTHEIRMQLSELTVSSLFCLKVAFERVSDPALGESTVHCRGEGLNTTSHARFDATLTLLSDLDAQEGQYPANRGCYWIVFIDFRVSFKTLRTLYLG